MNFNTDLLQYQERGANKLSGVKIGALYMEQGLGKTRTTLELINKRLLKGRINHAIWLCPCSVINNLKEEIVKQTGEDLKELITICGIETLSTSVTANSELLKLTKEKKCYLIVDESNMVKNHKAKRTENIIRLSKNCNYKLILNGTPITRNEADLFAQWYILDWRVLGYKSFWSFSANHLEYDEKVPGKVRRCFNIDYLTEKIAPYTYQVTKEECLKLPSKHYNIQYFGITEEQRIHYEEVADELLFKVDELEPHTIYRLFTGLQNVLGGFRVFTDGEHLQKESFFKEPMDNPRIKKLLKVIREEIGLGVKIIIFCKYSEEIRTIVEILNKEFGPYVAVPFNGDIKNKKRQENLNKFKNEYTYLVANKQCGAYGLNLQFCSTIIYYSNDWDYGTRAQSEDRIHRLGQEERVDIIDLCATDTLDKRIIKCLWRKEDLVESFKGEIKKVKDNVRLKSFIH